MNRPFTTREKVMLVILSLVRSSLNFARRRA